MNKTEDAYAALTVSKEWLLASFAKHDALMATAETKMLEWDEIATRVRFKAYGFEAVSKLDEDSHMWTTEYLIGGKTISKRESEDELTVDEFLEQVFSFVCKRMANYGRKI